MKKRNLIGLTTLLITSCYTIKAQVVGEIIGTKDYLSQEFWWIKPIADSSKFSFFSYNRFKVNFKSSEQNEFFNNSTLTYEIGKGFGVSAGGFLTNNGFSPIVALNYFYTDDNWLINIFPSIEIKENSNTDIFAFVQYRPKLSESLKLFSLVILNSNFNLKAHNFSEQNIRIGLDFKTFQFGIGSDSRQITFHESSQTTTNKTINLGLFLRKEFY